MIRIANAPCSWGVLEFDLAGRTPGYAQVLDEIRETGYDGTELGDWGFMPTDPQKLKSELNRRELKMLGAFIPIPLKDRTRLNDGIAAALKTALLMRDAGAPDAFIVLSDDNATVPERTHNAGRITPEMGLTGEQWRLFSDNANEVARSVKDNAGLRTVFHHHCGGYVETPEEVDRLMNSTDADLLGLVLDTGHYKFGGGNPVEAVRKYASRLWHVHFKDCDLRIAVQSREREWDYFESVRNGVFCELGKGSVDFKSVVTELQKVEYDGWIVVEQDVLPGMGKPRECAQYNRDYIKTLGI